MEERKWILVNREELNQEKVVWVVEEVQLEGNKWVLVSQGGLDQEKLFWVV